jgi:hypothetical protein
MRERVIRGTRIDASCGVVPCWGDCSGGGSLLGFVSVANNSFFSMLAPARMFSAGAAATMQRAS